MKKIIILVSLVFLLSSCASTTSRKHHENLAMATRDLGAAYLNQRNFTAALKELLNAEKTIPDDPYLHNYLGEAYLAKKRPDLAEKHFKKASTLKPDYIPAKNNLGTAYLKQKKWDQALKCFKSITGELLYVTPEYPLCNMGWAYLGKKEYRSAKESFAKALKLKPDFINAIHGLATTNIETEQAHLSVDLLTKAITKNPGIAILHYDLAKAYEALHQSQKAKQSWKAVVLLSPGSELASEAEVHLKY
ncbi:MAG: tetratricopeptide repeat protein [Thermodesulfobacteriota bacterium]|nr:tetratricopeptide repeat protein [Thermodesulfobacteriota bacterium]